MFENLKEKILGATVDNKTEKRLIKENEDVNRYSYEVLSLGDSAYICSMGARICYGLNVDKEYKKNRSHISRIVGLGHDSVSAHSNVVALIKCNGDCSKDLIEILPALKYMNIVHLEKVVKPEEEDGVETKEEYLLVSGSVRAFRYFFMTYDFYNTEISPLARQFVKIATDNFEKEFFEKLLLKTKLFSNILDNFDYFAPLQGNIVYEKDENTGEIEEIMDVSDDSGSIHYNPITSDRVDIIYADNIIDIMIYLVNKFPNIDKKILMKAVFDTGICTIILHDYSRAISQQINRHQSGISQESQRYVDYSKAQFVDPLSFDTKKYDVNKVYKVEIDGHDISGTSMELGTKLQSVYPQLKEQGMLSQDARSFLPFNVKTKAIHTFTITNYLHFIKVRTPKAAQAEIRVIANEMANVYITAINRMADEVEKMNSDYINLAKELEVMIINHVESLISKE